MYSVCGDGEFRSSFLERLLTVIKQWEIIELATIMNGPSLLDFSTNYGELPG